MIKKLWILLVLPLLLMACTGDEPDVEGLFRITCGIEVGVAEPEIAMGTHSVDFGINGEATNIRVTLIGAFNRFEISDTGVPDWITVSIEDKTIKLAVKRNDGSESRSFKLYYTVYKGSRNQSGYVSIDQAAITTDDLSKIEKEAIKSYLKKFRVIDTLPALSDIQVGSVAPFYKINPEGTVFMQLVRRGSEPAATTGQQISFRYFRYNLLSYYEDGYLPEGEGNLDSPGVVASFTLGVNSPSPSPWPSALQLPLLLGLPADCEVNLVVASSAGTSEDAADFVPYLYNIRYQ